MFPRFAECIFCGRQLDELGERAKALENAESALKIFEQLEHPNVEKVREHFEKCKK
jgi:hypothetical protein